MSPFLFTFLTFFVAFSTQATLPTSCGKRVYSGLSKIVGGSSTVHGEWPWQISLLEDNGHICGGTIIHKNWILTAAHCVENYRSPRRFKVVAGGQSRSGYESQKVTAKVSKIIPHASYMEWSLKNDIALIKLSSPLTFGNYIQPACIPEKSTDFASGNSDVSCWSSGWGLTSDSYWASPASSLLHVQLKIEPERVCRNEWNDFRTKYWLCVDGVSRGNTCEGDSGGPMSCRKKSSSSGNGPWYIAGVTSYGSTDTCYGVGAMTNVWYYKKWIQDNLAKY